MQAWFEPVLGPLGAVIAQFIVWTALVLVLLLVAWWSVRRFSRITPGSFSRSRVPRLAILDAMALDNRRRLVLIRRDNLEHLILIGGPTDVVIESAITRPQARKPAGNTARPDSRGGDPAENISIPPPAEGVGLAAVAPALPLITRPPPSAPPPAEPAAPDRKVVVDDAPAAAAVDEPSQPEAPTTAAMPEPARQTSEEPPAPPNDIEADTALPEPLAADHVEPAEIAKPLGMASLETDDRQAPSDPVEPAVPPADAPVSDHPADADSELVAPDGDTDDTAVRVNELEQEMARLLGETPGKVPE